MGGDIKMPNTTGCRVEEVQHLYPAAELYVSGSDNVITESEIAYASYTGVRLAGTRNTLSKSHVHHCNYYGTYDSLVEFGNKRLWIGASQNTLVDCSLHDTGRDGVNLRCWPRYQQLHNRAQRDLQRRASSPRTAAVSTPATRTVEGR